MLVVCDRLVFLHVPKTGGTWVKTALRSQGYHYSGPRFEHVPASEVGLDLPMFGFVRSPVDWYCSMFAYCKTTGANLEAAKTWLTIAGDSFPEFARTLATMGEDSPKANRLREWLHKGTGEGFDVCGRRVGSLVGSPWGFYSWLISEMFDLPTVRVHRFEDGLGSALEQTFSEIGIPLNRPLPPAVINASLRSPELLQGVQSVAPFIEEREKPVLERFGYQ